MQRSVIAVSAAASIFATTKRRLLRLAVSVDQPVEVTVVFCVHDDHVVFEFVRQRQPIDLVQHVGRQVAPYASSTQVLESARVGAKVAHPAEHDAVGGGVRVESEHARVLPVGVDPGRVEQLEQSVCLDGDEARDEGAQCGRREAVEAVRLHEHLGQHRRLVRHVVGRREETGERRPHPRHVGAALHQAHDDPETSGHACFIYVCVVCVVNAEQTEKVSSYKVLRTAESALHLTSLADLLNRTPSQFVQETLQGVNSS